MILYHLTLSTGDLRESPRSEVGPEAIAALRPLAGTEHGERIPVPGDCGLWMSRRSKIPGGAIVEIGAGDHVVILMGIAWNQARADTMWGSLVDLVRASAARDGTLVAPVLRQPPLPWCCVLLGRPQAALPPSIAMMLGDLERCIAWTLIEGGR